MFEGIFQPTHLLLVFGIALLVFGPKKLPELGKGIGEEPSSVHKKNLD
jgi:sec-independent protein translocase protein TatA